MGMISYSEEDKAILRRLLEDLFINGECGRYAEIPQIDWFLPFDNKLKIKRYKIYVGIEDGETD